MLELPGSWIPSLVRELSSCMLRGVAKYMYTLIYIYECIYTHTHLLRTSSPVREMGVQSSARWQLVSSTSYTPFFLVGGGNLLHLLNFFLLSSSDMALIFPHFPPPSVWSYIPELSRALSVHGVCCHLAEWQCSEYGVLISEGFLHFLVNSAHFSNEPQAAGGSTGVTP